MPDYKNKTARKQQMAETTTRMPQTSDTNIMVVDDDATLQHLLVASLERSGYNVIAAADGLEAIALFEQNRVDLILLDVIMPNMDGLATCAKIRETSDVPIVILSAMSRPDDMVHGFNLGADDYIAKPFTFREVEVRLQAILRRVSWIEEQPTFQVMSSGDIVLNDLEQEVTVRGEPIDLTPIEYQLLYQLMRTPGQSVRKHDLFKNVWGYEETGGTNLVEVAVRRLREKIEDNPSKPSYLLTVRGTGYKLAETCAVPVAMPVLNPM